MPSHISRVEPLRPECPSCRPIFAELRSWTKEVTRRQASRCPSFHRPGQPGVIRPSGETQTISVITRPAPPSALEPRCTRWKSPGTPSTAEYMSIGETTIRLFSGSGPIRTGWNIAGTVSDAPWPRANSRSISSANPASRSFRFSKVIRRERVSRLKTNCAGCCPAYMPMFSNHSSEACAARCVDSTTGLRSAWYASSASATVGRSCRQAASARASSMASLVPDPIEKCAVCAASPSSTTLPSYQRSLRTVVKFSQRELLVRTRWPASSAAKISAIRPTAYSSDSPGPNSRPAVRSKPARRHTSSCISTMKVEPSAEYG